MSRIERVSHTNDVVHVAMFCLAQIEERISIDTLDALKRTFESADVDGSGALELPEFKKLLRTQLNLPAGKVSRGKRG